MSAHRGGDFMADIARKLLAAEEPKKPRALRGLGDAAHSTACGEASEAIARSDFSLFLPRHFVALYDLLHQRVYGLAPSELVPKTRTIAAGMAKRLLDREFEGDRGEMAQYMRWVFNREAGRHAWRVREGKPLTRIGFGFCFGGALVTDWRLALTQGGARR